MRISKILLVDDHPVFRLGLSKLIENEEDLSVVAEAGDALSAMAELDEKSIDVAVIDLSLAESSGLDLIKQIRGLYAQLPMLVVSMHDETLFAERALKAGADGFMMKSAKPEKLLEAIRQTSRREIALSTKQSSVMLSQLFKGNGLNPNSSLVTALSDREIEVFEQLGHGKSTKAIAKSLHISTKTVETHQAHIKRKLNLSNFNELIRSAAFWVNEVN